MMFAILFAALSVTYSLTGDAYWAVLGGLSFLFFLLSSATVRVQRQHLDDDDDDEET